MKQHYQRLWSLMATFLVAATIVPAQTLTSSMFGDVRARPLGPATMSGRIADIAIAPSTPTTWFIGSAGGGVWKSVNGGISFASVFDDHNQSIGALAVDPKNDDTVWVGTGEHWVRNSVSSGDGLYRSTDGGKTWKRVGFERSERIARIVVHPTSSSTITVAVLGHLWSDHDEGGVFQSTDFGATWKRILAPTNASTGCSDLSVNPKNPNDMIAAMWDVRRTAYSFRSGGPGSGLFRTLDGGRTWRPIRTGLPGGNLGRICVAHAPSNPSIVYANVEADTTALYISTNGGASWRRRNTTIVSTLRPFYFSRLVVAPDSAGVVYKTGLQLHRSVDSGATFSSLGSSVHSDHHALWINPAATGTLVAATDGGLYQSFDLGQAWRFCANLPLGQFYHVAVDNSTPYNIYGGLQDNGSWMGPSQSHRGLTNAEWMMVGGGDGFAVVPDPANERYVYWESQGGNINRYDRTTRLQRETRPAPHDGSLTLRWNWDSPIVASRNASKAVYAGSQYVHRSTDHGATWKRVSPDLTTNDPAKQQQENSGGLTVDNSSAENHCTIVTIADSPLDTNVILAGSDDGRLHRTTNGGTSWTELHPSVAPAGTWVSCIEPSWHDMSVMYATFDGHRTGDHAAYVARSEDAGRTWQRLGESTITGYAHVVREDPADPAIVVVGTEHGLWLSLDTGRTFIHFRNGLPTAAVRDMVFHRRDADLILATHGRGIYVLDNIEILHSLVRASRKGASAPLRFLESAAGVIPLPGGNAWFNGDAEFSGTNPNNEPSVWYYLTERHTKGPFTISVLDSAGRELRTMPATTRRGINRVPVPLRGKGPRVAYSAVTVAGGAIVGPLLPEGTYRVELRRSMDTVRGSFRVQFDPGYDFTEADKAAQRALTDTLFALNERLADVTVVARVWSDTLTARIERTAKNVPDVVRMHRDSLSALNASLVNTKVGMLSGEEQVREKLAALFGEVMGYPGRPTDAQQSFAIVLATKVAAAQQTVLRLVDNLDTVNRAMSSASMEPWPLSGEVAEALSRLRRW
ncbi:MAG: glycosyl hydrolase [Candidatus Kapabacteria bacterium]|nr:glycosyl hydrolase [Candidatus Kapabacteria bacterium]